VPLYELECSKCHYRFERLQRFSDPPPGECPECGGPVSQILSPTAIQFKGSGWYATDYAKKSSSPAPTNGNKGGSAPKSETKSESKSTENK
jgi:putative FmdB family regulatory protein